MRTGAVVRGSRTAIAWAEDWVFQRPLPGGPPESISAACPQCGAPLDLDVAGVCRSCDAELHGPPAEWLLSRIDLVPDEAQSQAA